MRRLALVPTLIAALLLPGGAHALGLGEIEIQSALNQRLDAEIPLRGVPGGQAEGIEVSLASEEAFSNVGLDRPFSLTRLQFAVKQRSGGGHYIHITSRESIVEPFLSFLVEVDWSGGNLLREYTVLLDPPVFTSEEDSGVSGGATTDAARTSDASDGAGVTGEIERKADSSGAQSDADDGERSASGSSPTGSGAGEDKPVFLEVEEREERARAQADAERAEGSGASTSRTAGAPEQYGPVGDGETLWSIASRLKSGDMTVQQMMIALLRYNPDAFGDSNINRLKKGYVLRVPDADRVLEVSAQRALARVREQNGVWRELQEGSRSRTSVAASDQGAGDAGIAGEGATGTDDGELSIVGADDGGASSDEAASATGSSSRDESEKLQLAREELESTRLEKEELESRVNELEQTVSSMEKLLEVRDERLSALQEELRKLEGRQVEDEESQTVADDETGSELASADVADEAAGDDEEAATDGGSATAAATGDDDETVAAADGDSGDDAGAGTDASGGGSTDGDTSATGDGETASDGMVSADAADSGESESAQTTASAGDEADASYIPEDKQATEADRGVETTRTQEPQETWLDQVNSVIAAVTGVFAGVGGGLLGGPMGFGLAAAIVLLGGGLILMRRRREAAESDDLDAFDPDDTNAGLAPFDADSSGQFDARGPDVDSDDTDARQANAEDAQSALMEEEFDVASLDEEEAADRGAGAPLDEPSRGADDEAAEKDDTIAEADVYLAYGLHQQSEDLLRLALREQSGNAMYHEKLLETLYASGKTEEFIEEAETFRGLVDGPESRLWQRVLAMGRELAPQHELFAEGDTEFTAADVQPTRPAGTDLELDAADGDIDFGFDDEPESASAGASDSAGEQDDDFSSTMMLDSADFEAVEGDGGLVGPDDHSGGTDNGAAGVAAAGDGDEDEDLEFDLGDLDGLSEGESASATASPGPAAAAGDPDEIDFDLDDDRPAVSGDPERSEEAADDGALDFDLDFEEPESPQEGLAGIDESDPEPAEAPASADSGDGGLDFDFDLEETSADSSASAPGEQHSAAAEPAGSADDEPLEIGDLEIGDLDSLEDAESGPEAGSDDTEASHETTPAGVGDEGAGEAGVPDVSDLDTGLEEASADETAGAPATGDDRAAADDAFDLSDLDGVGAADDDDPLSLDDLGATEPDAPEAVESAPATGPDVEESADAAGGATASGGTDSAPDEGEDEEFDTMLDLARAYIDMGDPESAANALEEVAASGNEQQRSEAQSLLESVR